MPEEFLSTNKSIKDPVVIDPPGFDVRAALMMIIYPSRIPQSEESYPTTISSIPSCSYAFRATIK
jgi:hypothetical protein